MVETARDQIDERVVFEIAGRGEDHVGAREVLAVVVEQGVLLEAAYGLLGPQNRFAQGVVLPEILGKDLVHQVVGIVLVHLDLFENDAPLAENVLIVEDWVQHQVGENVERGGHVLVENF